VSQIDREQGSIGTLGPRRTEKISEVLAREIVRDLRDLPPATMLPSESVMLKKYGVGRASLREALRLLEVQGLVVIRPGPGGGPMVAQVDSTHYGRISTLYYHMLGATYRDVVDARLVLEPVIARIVAERQDPEHMAKLTEWLDEVGSPGPHDYLGEASAFHAMLVSMSGNPVLELTVHALQLIYAERAHGWVFPPEEHHHVEQAHRAIVLAILKGNASRAEVLMRKHMLDYVENSRVNAPIGINETVDWH